MYRQLSDMGFKVMLDDREITAGAKLKEADLIGIPWQIIIGAKSLAEGQIEWPRRKDGQIYLLPQNEIHEHFLK